MQVDWGIFLVAIGFMEGLVGGTYIVSILNRVFGKERYKPVNKLSAIISTAILLAIPVLFLLDLGQPSRGTLIFLRGHITSLMTLGAWVMMLCIIILFVRGWFMFREGNVRRGQTLSGFKRSLYRLLALNSEDLSESSLQRDATMAKILGAIGIPLIALFATYEGFMYGTTNARELWFTALTPISWMVSAIISGIALVIVVSTVMWRFSEKREVNGETSNSLGTLLGWFIFMAILVELSGVVMGIFSGGQASFTTSMATIVLGLVIPLLLLVVPAVRRSVVGGVIAPILVLIGSLASKYTLIIGGQLVPRSGQTLLTYTIHMEEIYTLIGVTALGLFFFMVGVWILPWKNDNVEVA